MAVTVAVRGTVSMGGKVGGSDSGSGGGSGGAVGVVVAVTAVKAEKVEKLVFEAAAIMVVAIGPLRSNGS